MDISYTLGIFYLGAIFGSFVTVLIYRLPRNLSLLRPASSCPACGHRLRWYENVPLISWLVLRGRCHRCNIKISPRYILVEALSGILFVILYYSALSMSEFIYLGFCALLFLALIFIDYEFFILPNKLLFALGVVTLVYLFIYNRPQLAVHLSGALIVGLTLVSIRFLAGRVFKKESLGLGDVKLGILFGLMIGWSDALLAIFFGFLIAGIIIMLLMLFKRMKREDAIPFGPFMIAGFSVYVLWGDLILQWYLHLVLGHAH